MGYEFFMGLIFLIGFGCLSYLFGVSEKKDAVHFGGIILTLFLGIALFICGGVGRVWDSKNVLSLDAVYTTVASVPIDKRSLFSGKRKGYVSVVKDVNDFLYVFWNKRAPPEFFIYRGVRGDDDVFQPFRVVNDDPPIASPTASIK